MLRRLRRITLLVLAVLVGLTAVLALTLTLLLRGSLPPTRGERTLPGLAAPVTVARDQWGVPDIVAGSRADAARALGYAHAQDRFFQMDLQRRGAAGELAALLGPPLLPTDRSVRIHRFRRLAKQVVAGLPADHAAVLDAYTAGVNAGLDGLRVRPWEYLLLRQKPRPWLPEDSVLVICAMFLDLGIYDARTERMQGMVADLLPPALADYLLTPAGLWDAPVMEGPPYQAAIPDSAAVDLRRWGPSADAPTDDDPEPVARADAAGSNSWAVAGSLTAHGGALLANDMHLGLVLPNIWYRARMSWPEGGGTRALVGATLPGTPALVVGSNGDVAWGFTNSYTDQLDLVRLEVDAADADRYRTPGGWERMEIVAEVIAVAGAAPDTLRIRQTRWGPVWTTDAAGAPLALRWTAHDAGAVDMNLLELETVTTVDEAVGVAAGAGIPPQNFLCADSRGDIAWTIAGRLPKRFGWGGRRPVSWADGSCGWDGLRAPAGMPRIVRPPEGRLWTANNRVVGGQALAVLGDGGYGAGARATQIRDGLRSLDRPDEAAMLALQLDDRALHLDHWRQLALATVADDTSASRREFARLLTEDWDGRASVGSAGYRVARAFMNIVVGNVYRCLTAPVWTQHDDFRRGQDLPYRNSIAWELLRERPPHMILPVYFRSWDALVLDAVDGAMNLATDGGTPAAAWTWGKRNTVRVAHPFLEVAPRLGRWLAAPAVALPGDSHMPRVQHPRHGASQRMVVSPGREEDGIFHMPGGQSGHPLSRWYLEGWEDWAEGRAAGLLPGHGVERLRLVP
jgi:penicillin amidase